MPRPPTPSVSQIPAAIVASRIRSADTSIICGSSLRPTGWYRLKTRSPECRGRRRDARLVLEAPPGWWWFAIRALRSECVMEPRHAFARSPGLVSRPAARDAVVVEATITCPLCGASARERMPESACQLYYVCTGCGERLRPAPGDCCVFCSYADTVCPPMQKR